MDKALLLLSTFVLLLSSSQIAEQQRDNAMKSITVNVLDEKVKKNALDIFRTAYNVHSNDTSLSNIMDSKLWLEDFVIFGEVKLGQTTCIKIGSDLDNCPFKTEFHLSLDNQGTVSYIKSKPGVNMCNKFLSELANCPFSEQKNKKELATCSIVFANFALQKFVTILQFKCLEV